MPFDLNEDQMVLSPKESVVLLLLAKGRTAKQVAETLCRAESTVKTHIEHIRDKLGSVNAAHMVSVAFEKGVLKLLPCFLMAIVLFNCIVPRLDSATALRRPPRVVRVSRTIARVRVERLGGAFG